SRRARLAKFEIAAYCPLPIAYFCSRRLLEHLQPVDRPLLAEEQLVPAKQFDCLFQAEHRVGRTELLGKRDGFVRLGKLQFGKHRPDGEIRSAPTGME